MSGDPILCFSGAPFQVVFIEGEAKFTRGSGPILSTEAGSRNTNMRGILVLSNAIRNRLQFSQREPKDLEASEG